MVPYQLCNALKNIKNIRCLLIGGGFLSHSIKKKIQTSESNIYETFGMAETLLILLLEELQTNQKNFFLLYRLSKLNKTRKVEVCI